jgi:hypothetical protein
MEFSQFQCSEHTFHFDGCRAQSFISCFAGLHQHTCSIIYYTEKGKQEISKLFVILEIFCLESQMQKGMYIGIRGSMFSFKGKALIVGT